MLLFFSSQADQYSYQDDYLSYFTKSIAESILNHSTTSIRYKDIVDYISDTFESENKQTPFYVIQADLTENFCSITNSLRSALQRILSKAAQPLMPSHDLDKPQSLIELIEADAKRYCSEEEALARLKTLADTLKDAAFSEELGHLYTISCSEAADLSDLPDQKAIGKWIEKNGFDYFAEAEKEWKTEVRRVPKDPFRFTLNLFGSSITSDKDNEYVTKSVAVEYVIGYQSTVDLPYSYLTILAEPLFPNLRTAVCFVAPILSRTRLQVFSSFGRFKETSWDGRQLSTDVQWTSFGIDLKNDSEVISSANNLLKRFQEYILTPIRELFLPATAPEENSESDDKSEDQQVSETTEETH